MAQLGSLSDEMETLSYVLRLVEAFRAFDGDSDGSITVAELGGIMGSLGYNPSEQDVKAMMQRGDANRDGLLSVEEFLEIYTRDLELGSLGTYLGSAFEALNVEGDEAAMTVTGDELYAAMREMGFQLSLTDCQHIIDSMDADGDGAVSFEDLKLIINSLL